MGNIGAFFFTPKGNKQPDYVTLLGLLKCVFLWTNLRNETHVII